MKIRFTFIFIIIYLISVQVYSQKTSTIKGKIFNSKSNDAITNANVAVANSNKGTSSDRKGFFELRIAEGKYKLRVSSVGFESREISLDVVSGDNDFLEVGLQPLSKEIEKVDVLGNFPIQGRDTSINKVALSILPAITTVSKVDIEKQGAVTLSDALKYVPGGWTETRGRKSKQFFSVRGQKYPYPDYSIDGVWQKEFEETAYFLSALDIESVEIVRSSNALAKGLSGLTGVIEVKTKKPEKETVSLLAKYGENNNYVTSLQYGNKIKELSFNTSASFFGTDGIPDRNGKERISNFHGNMDWDISKNLSLKAGVTYISGMREFVAIVDPGLSKLATREEKFDPVHTWVTYAKLSYKGNDGSQTDLQANYSYRDANYQNYNLKNETTSTHHDKDSEFGLNILHSRPLSTTNTLRVGALYNHWVAPDGKRYYAGRRCDVHTWSGVITDEQKFGSLLLDAGFRLIGGHIDEWGGFGIEGSSSGFSSVASIVDEASPIEWQSTFGGSYVLSKATSLHYNFSGGSVAPRKGSLNADGETPGNETRFQHELGFRYKCSKNNEFTASAFYAKRNDAIGLSGETVVADNDDIVELYENIDKNTLGVELATKLNIPVLYSSVFANAVFMKNQEKEDGDMVEDKELPQTILNAGVQYEHSGIDANLFVHYTGKYHNNRFVNTTWVEENGDYPLGDYLLLDFTGGYTFSGKLPVRLFVEVKNILDDKYESVACYPDAGRLFMVGVKLSY